MKNAEGEASKNESNRSSENGGVIGGNIERGGKAKAISAAFDA